MTVGVNRLIDDLRAVGWKVTGPLFCSGNMDWVIADDFPIPAGRFAGMVVRVAVPVQPDYPATPPGGL
jgi:hypothetical protein